MKHFILAGIFIFTPTLWAQNLVKNCTSRNITDNFFGVDCDLAKLQIFETRNIENNLILGRASYTVIFRFTIKNPGTVSHLVLEKAVAGAVEECIIQTMYDVGSVALILQSPSPQPGSTMLINRMQICMQTILSQQLLDEIDEGYDLVVRKDGWMNLRQIKADE